jgi:hypothetical protein
VPIESLIRVTVPVIGAVAGFVLVVRLKVSLDAFAAGRPVPPLLPEVTVPWKAVGVAAGTLLLTVMTALLVLSCRIVSQARQDDQRRRAALEARHDRVLEDLGARLADDPACPFLDEPVLFEALQEAQDARTGTAQDRYRAAVRTLDTQWRATAAGTTAPTA